MTEIVLGPPGTGKTSTLLGYVEDALTRGVPPADIGYVSFTTRAADEAVRRACEKFSLKPADLPNFRTLHSICFRRLQLGRGDVLEGAKLGEFAKHVGVRISGRGLSEDGTMTGYDSGDRMLFMDNLARVRGVPLRRLYDQDDDRLAWAEVERFSRALVEFKAARGLMDFTDMLQEFLRSGVRLHLRELYVDEAQDLSKLQWLVVDRLAEGCQRAAVAGDDDQAIYRWAGADVDHLIDMHGEVRVLGQSWRVPPAVQRVADEVIGCVRKRRPKRWKAREGAEGAVARTTEFSDTDCSVGQTLILARNAYVLREQVEPELRRQGVVYERFGRSSVDGRILDAARDWELLRRGNKVEVERVRNVYRWMSAGRGYVRGKRELSGWQDDRMVDGAELRRDGGLMAEDAPWFDALDKLPQEDVGYLRAARRRGEKLSGRPRVVLSTIHGAKGGEADHVVLMKEMAARTHHEMLSLPDDEARVWYVGATRARERLTIVESQTARRCPWL